MLYHEWELLPAQTLRLSLQDAWSDQKGQIHRDAHQDYQLLQAQRTPNGLFLLFKRPFVTCDPKDYVIEVGCPVQEFSFPEASLLPKVSGQGPSLHGMLTHMGESLTHERQPLGRWKLFWESLAL